jgi:hypothetical protein
MSRHDSLWESAFPRGTRSGCGGFMARADWSARDSVGRRSRKSGISANACSPVDVALEPMDLMINPDRDGP